MEVSNYITAENQYQNHAHLLESLLKVNPPDVSYFFSVIENPTAEQNLPVI